MKVITIIPYSVIISWDTFYVTVVDECSSRPCERGECEDEVGYYTCLCDTDYAGQNCDRCEYK